MYKGQPISSTTQQISRAKIGDGKSVKVTVPESTTILAQSFYLLSGFFGVAAESVTTAAGETANITLTIDQAEYETDKIVTTETFNKGDKIYWDNTVSKFTVTAGTNRLVGRVSEPKDANNVIWFILLPQYA